MKLLIVEDELEFRELMVSLLEDEFDVAAVEDGLRLQENLEMHKPDLILLDQMLPGKSGAECLRELRAHPVFNSVPVIMVTGFSGEDDKVQALDAGADDYVTKPFSTKELSARIRAVYRRVSGVQSEPEMQTGNLKVDFASHKVLLGEQEINLTLTEFKILAELVKRSGHVLSRENLRARALGNLNVTDRTIDVHMASLRKKLSQFGGQIETVRGVGYRLYSQAS